PPLPDLLRKYGLLERIGPGRLYPTDRDAVAAFRQETGAPAGAPPEAPGGQAADSPLEALD
ncbi:MAG TPA: hypothetical protein VHQ00_06775, partial [Chloroflexota bacterium]|nr:hypothetical protein [Chloroflexota bacterium]